MSYEPRRDKAARLRRARGIPGYVPTTEVARHIRTLQDAGWSRTRIAYLARVHPNTIHGIINTVRPTVQQRTAQAILALTPDGSPQQGVTE